MSGTYVSYSASTANSGGGTVTQIDSGPGLTGGPITGTGTLSVASVSLANQVVDSLPLSQTTGSISLTNRVSGILPAANSSGLNLLSGSVSLVNQVVGSLPITQTSGSVSLVNKVTGNLPLSQTSGSISLTTQVSGILPAANSSGLNLLSGSVSLANQVVDNLPVTNLNGGSGASSATFWRGDGTWNSGTGSFASVALDNLASTAVNTNIVPAADDLVNLGSATKRWHIGYYGDLQTTTLRQTTVSGTLTILTPNASGSNASGIILLTPGTVSSGTGIRGTIQFQDGSEGVARKIWASSDASGSGNWVTPSTVIGSISLVNQVVGNLPVTNLNTGSGASSATFWRGDGIWAAPAGAGANTSLSNLASTTAINAHLIPGRNGFIDLGSISSSFLHAYVATVNNPQVTGTLALTTADSSTPDDTGLISIKSGDQGTSGQVSGNVTITTGTTVSSAHPGNLNLQTGLSGSANNSGNIVIQTGLATSSRGTISLDAGDVRLKAFNSNPMTLRFFDASNTNYISFQATGTVSAAVTLVLPGTQGSSTSSVMKNDGAGNLSWSRAQGVTVQTFASASGTYTTPTGCLAIKVTVVAGGGGGGGAATGVGASAGGAGGGAGAVAIKWISTASLSATYSYSVADGGPGGSAGANAGVAGSVTTFGSVVSAGGGAGGNGSSAVSTVTINATGAPGGSGALALVGDVLIPGGCGGANLIISATNAISGDGGGNSFSGRVKGIAATAAGNAGQAYGGGGGGAVQINNGGDQAGGKGAGGLVVVEEYYA